MKKIVLFLMLISLSLHSQERLFGIRSGEVHYDSVIDIMGNIVEAKVYILFDDYGRKNIVRTIVDINIMGVNEKADTSILDTGEGDRYYLLDNLEKTYITLEDSDEEIDLFDVKGDKIGSSRVLGKNTDIYYYEEWIDGEKIEYRTWIWEGIPLKTEVKSESEYGVIANRMTAVKFDTKFIGSYAFEIPRDYKERVEKSYIGDFELSEEEIENFFRNMFD